MNYSEIVKCQSCGKTMPRGVTLILENKRGRFRICRDCYANYEEGKFKENMQEARDNVKKFGIVDTDPFDVMRKKEQFVKDIKEGKWQNIL